MNVLCLTRRINERVILTLPDGSSVVLTVLGHNHRGHVRLGIEAPKDVSIAREELLDRPGEGKKEGES